MTDDKKELEAKLGNLPPTSKAFVEGYGEGTAGWKPEAAKKQADKGSRNPAPEEGYDLNLQWATNRVCLRCGAVVARFDLHDNWHERLDSQLPTTVESEVDD